MGSTGEADRKRRHFSSLSPTAVAAKKQPFLPISEEKKLDAAVLQFQNQKLQEKLEAQKIEYSFLENKLFQLKEKQQPYDSTLKVVNSSWEVLITDLESHSICARESSSQENAVHTSIMDGVAPSTTEDAFLSRLVETGATENSSSNNSLAHTDNREETQSEKTRNILLNIVAAINDLWNLKNCLYPVVLKDLRDNGAGRQKPTCELESEVKNLRLAVNDLFLRHKSLARELQSHQDIDARNKAELKQLKGELESVVAELEKTNCKLAALKAEKNATKGAFFPVLNIGSNHVAGDRVKDRAIDLQDLESVLKELLDQSSSRLVELKGLHEERIRILQQLSYLQNKIKSVKCISSSQAYLFVRDQLQKSKSEVLQYQALLEKLQVEKDNLAWRESELSIKNDLVDVFWRTTAVVDSRASDLGIEIQRQIDEIKKIQTKMEEASREPGRKEIISEFKSLLSSFPEAMSNMQSQLSKYKEDSMDIHSLRADMQSLSSVLDRKAKECENLSARSAAHIFEMHKLQAMVQELKESDVELKLILDMYICESTYSRDVSEARDSEYKAWAHVQSLKSSLDEQNLELRVKMANEAEAVSQQRLATAEAEIADLRQKLDVSKREKTRFSGALRSKSEENEAYLSEIETIGQAYDDMQTQNQHLLLQITERDDYNIKLVLEGLKAKQLQEALLLEKRTMHREIQLANASLELYDMKAARIEDQLRFCSDQVQKLSEDRLQSFVSLENLQKRLLDVRQPSNQVRESLQESQSKIEKNRGVLVELQIEFEEERFNKKRIEEELEVARRKLSCIQAQRDGSSIVEKLQQELWEYKEILKCSICLDRSKEVVITKCYHLFCNPCVQRVTESRHRKCPVCAASFGPNDVKSVYI
ncbi:hypothetical protein SLEP1_g23900 [Rubroshorea leprosula]|uniref:E3 ubiquitin protein ligase n=1 Tax=Rubroshorea leprosula TaxID=152421 RepID=A0AAV5JML1_9ROSI|nr:hypothetical protein SLEP1_g23900 [Rubroshorea leprosula]